MNVYINTNEKNFELPPDLFLYPVNNPGTEYFHSQQI